MQVLSTTEIGKCPICGEAKLCQITTEGVKHFCYGQDKICGQ